MVLQEDGAAIEVTVLRYGGSLTTRYVQHIIEPNGVFEFYGATYVMKFEPGETSKNSTIIARSDGTPEVTRIFKLHIFHILLFVKTFMTHFCLFRCTASDKDKMMQVIHMVFRASSSDMDPSQ